MEEVKKILKNHPNLDVNWTDEGLSWQTALFTASQYGYDAIVTILLAHPDIDVNLRSDHAVSPFMVVCRCGYPSCAREMLKDSRVKVNEPRNDGHTPLWDAALHGHLDVIKLWIASGREMDLGTPGEWETDAIGEAEEEGEIEAAALLERFKGDASETRDEIRMELGITGQYSCSSPLIFPFRPH